MEVQWKKHVRVICDLEVGDLVTVDPDFGPPLRTGVYRVDEIIYLPGKCESGFMIEISGYKGSLDSNWLNKVENKAL